MLKEAMKTGTIFDIKRYAINDGPGIRLTVFLKGCPLSCTWCHNPESIDPNPQKMLLNSACIGCGECVKACPHGACELGAQGISTNQSKCDLCGLCAKVCPSEATEMAGRRASVAEIMEMVDKEILFFDKSGGGVSFSGGEPLMQVEFLLALLEACGARHIHRAVDTCGLVPIDDLLRVAQDTELFLYDLKLMDPVRHKRYTGARNERILSNLQALAEAGAKINIRIPLIKGVNADQANLEQTGAFVAALAGEQSVNLLPFHEAASQKYLKLSMPYDLDGIAEPSEETVEQAVACLQGYDLNVRVGG
jgi:pyruvate formate lyase activating enzyme